MRHLIPRGTFMNGNAALHAAFLSAQAGSPVTMQFALAAAKAEFVKLDRPINENDFVP